MGIRAFGSRAKGGEIMTAKSWPEIESKVAELERENEINITIIHMQNSAIETYQKEEEWRNQELEVYKKALDIENDPPHRDWLLDRARKELQNGKEL